MRRGIASFRFLARLASVAIGVGLLAGHVAQHTLSSCCVYEAPPPPLMGMDPLPAALTAQGAGNAWEIRGLTLSPCDLPTTSFTVSTPGIPAPQFWSQESTGIPGASEFADFFGSALAAGDFNGDGRSDLAIGIPEEDLTRGGATVADTGRIVVIYGSSSGLTATDTTVPPPQSFDLGDSFLQGGEGFGSALAWGDFNGDGVGDLAIGVPGFTGSEPDEGQVRVLLGTQDAPLSTARQRAFGQTIGRVQFPEGATADRRDSLLILRA